MFLKLKWFLINKMEENYKIYSSLSLLCFNLFLASLVLVVLSYFSVLSLDILIDSNIIFGAGMFLGFISLVFWEKSKGNWEFHLESKVSKTRNKEEEKEIKSDDNLFFKAIPYLFLLMLLIIALNQFFKWDFVTAQMMRITILAITFGAITFWRNRNGVEKEIEDEKVNEEKAEEKRANEFDSKFKRLAWFNFSYGVADSWKQGKYIISILRAIVSPFIWLVRLPYSFVKWMYKEGWWYSGALIAIVGIFIAFKTAMIIIYNGSFLDEYLHIWSGISFFNNGQFAEITLNTIYYRGWMLSLLIGVLFELFGEQFILVKIIPAIFGLSSFILLYFIAKRVLINKKFILLLLCFYTLSPLTLFNHFYFRMYVLFEFLLLLSIFLFLKLVESKNNKKKIIFYIILICFVNLINFLVNDLESGLILLVNIILCCFAYLQFFPIISFVRISNFLKKYSLFILIILLILLVTFFSPLGSYIYKLVSEVFLLQNDRSYVFYQFLFKDSAIFTIVFFSSIFFIKKLRFSEGIILVGIALVSFHLTFVDSLKLIRVILYLAPLYYLNTVFALLALKKKKLFLFLIIVLLFFSLYASYPKNFFLGPGLPNEVRYIDNNLYKDALNICNNSLIIVSGRPGIAEFFGVHPDYYLNTKYGDPLWVDSNSESNYSYYDFSKKGFFDVYTGVPLLTSLPEVQKVYLSSKICYLDGGLPYSWVDRNIEDFITNQSEIHLNNYRLSEEDFKMQLYIKNHV